MKKSKKLFSIILCFVMMCSLLPTATYALSGSGTKSNPYVASSYTELKDLMANAPTDGTTRYIKLGMDITSEDMQNDYTLTTTGKDQDVVLDLAGKKITRKSTVTVDRSVIRAIEGKLTINDSVGTGGVYAQGVIESAVGLVSANAIYADNGTVIINGGTYEAAVKSGHGVYNEGGYLYIFGGTFRGTYGLYASAGKTYVYGGEYISTSGNETRYSITVAEDQDIKLFNFTAHNVVRLTGSSWSLWDYIESDGKLYVDGVKQSRTSTKEYEGNTVKLETPVTYSLNMTVDEPTPGREIVNKGYSPMGTNYYVLVENDTQVFSWLEGSNASIFAAGNFKKNTIYTASMRVKVEGHISPFLTATVNNNDANLTLKKYDETDNYSIYLVDYTFPKTVDNELTSAAATLTLPAAGATANSGTIFTSAMYKVRVYWSDTADDYLSNFNGKTFEQGKTYYCDIYADAQSPYVFTEGSKIIINGKAYDAQWAVGSSHKDYICVLDVPFTVEATHTHTYESDLQRATMSSAGYEQQVCSVCGKKGSKRTIAQLKSVTLSTAAYTYDGKVKKPAVVGKDVDGKTVDLSHSFIDYDKGRKNVGTYEVYITLAGDYSGVFVRTFKINPKGTSVSKATSPKKKQLKVTWKKQTTQTTGYEIQVATDSKFTKNVKKATVSKNKTTSKTISKLKSGKKYYVRIRTYKTVGKTKYYSGWKKYSKAIKVK